ncbi:MAG: hypothetical protein K2N73_08410 [Lachnospiraceae bacterium]|nr:hypothetical protein [Lachnospiraceae bacterium]
MKLIKKLNNRIKILLLTVTIMQILLWIGYLTEKIIMFKNILPFILIAFAVLTLGLWMLGFCNFFTKGFQDFYNGLDAGEKMNLDSKVESMSDSQNTIFMEKYLVNYSFIVLKAIPYKNIASVQNLGKKLLVFGKEPKDTVALVGTNDMSVADMLESIRNKNQEIIVK